MNLFKVLLNGIDNFILECQLNEYIGEVTIILSDIGVHSDVN